MRAPWKSRSAWHSNTVAKNWRYICLNFSPCFQDCHGESTHMASCCLPCGGWRSVDRRLAAALASGGDPTASFAHKCANRAFANKRPELDGFLLWSSAVVMASSFKALMQSVATCICWQPGPSSARQRKYSEVPTRPRPACLQTHALHATAKCN